MCRSLAKAKSYADPGKERSSIKRQTKKKRAYVPTATKCGVPNDHKKKVRRTNDNQNAALPTKGTIYGKTTTKNG